MSDKTAFEKAFAAARKAGKKTFTFNGKSYNTKLKESKTTKKSENKDEDSWLQKLHKKVFPSKYKLTDKRKNKKENEGMYQKGCKLKSKKYDHEAEKKRLLKKGKKSGTFFGFHKKGGFRNTSESWIESPNLSIDD